MSGSKVRALLLTSVRTAILSWRATYVQCFVYSPLHVRLCVTHALSYGRHRQSTISVWWPSGFQVLTWLSVYVCIVLWL